MTKRLTLGSFTEDSSALLAKATASLTTMLGSGLKVTLEATCTTPSQPVGTVNIEILQVHDAAQVIYLSPPHPMSLRRPRPSLQRARTCPSRTRSRSGLAPTSTCVHLSRFRAHLLTMSANRLVGMECFQLLTEFMSQQLVYNFTAHKAIGASDKNQRVWRQHCVGGSCGHLCVCERDMLVRQHVVLRTLIVSPTKKQEMKLSTLREVCP